MKTPVKIALILWVILVHAMLAGGAYYLWNRPKEMIKGKIKYVPVPKYIKKIEKELVPLEGVRIEFFSKDQLADTLKMPELKNLSENVTAVGEVGPNEGKTTVISTLYGDNVLRGRMIYRKEPPPFFALKKDFRLEAMYLPIGDDIGEANIVAYPLRTGPIYWTAKAGFSINEDGGIKGHVGIGIQYRFGGAK